MEDKDFFEILRKFLSNEHLPQEELDSIIRELKIILERSISIVGRDRVQRLYEFKEDIREEAFEDMMEHIVNKADIIISTFSNDPRGIKSYIKTISSNLLRDKMAKKNRKPRNLITYELSDKDEKEAQSPYENDKTLAEYRTQQTLLEADELANIIIKELSNAELEALCHTLKRTTPSNRSKNASDKARSRAGRRISTIVKKYQFSIEELKIALKILFLSEKCSKIVSSNRDAEKGEKPC